MEFDIDGLPLAFGLGDNQGSDAVFLTVIEPDGSFTAVGRVSEMNPPTADQTTTVFGIKTKLSLAFLVMTALTVVACAIAWLVFGQIQRTVSVVTERSIPEITLALSIAEVSADITSAAPAIVSSNTQEERLERRQFLDRSGEQLAELIDGWQKLGIASDGCWAPCRRRVDEIADRSATADAAVEKRPGPHGTHRRQFGATRHPSRPVPRHPRAADR